MKYICGILSFSVLLGCNIQKDSPQPSIDCRDQIIERLDLQAEVPEVRCPEEVTLLRLDGEFYYRVRNIGPSCNSVVIVYDCAGNGVCAYGSEGDCRERFEEQAVEVDQLGYL